MDGTPSLPADAWAMRAARFATFAQALMLVVVAAVIVLEKVVLAMPCCTGQQTRGCQTCWLVGGSRIGVVLAVPCVLFAFIYAAMALALRHEPRGQWVMLALTEALLPVIVLTAHLENGSWSFSTPWLLGWVPNLAILALLMTPSALRSAWGRSVA